MRPVRIVPLFACLVMAGCASVRPAADGVPEGLPSGAGERAFLDALQADTFRFFWETTPADTGLTPDRFPGNGVSSIAAVGFALTSYTVGVDRGYVTREQAAGRVLATLRFLWEAPQGPQPRDTAGYNGFFYHFLDGHTGRRAGDSELSTIDTALLMAGVLACQVYFDGPDPAETAIRGLADDLYRRVDWTWASSAEHRPLLGMGWSPEHGFIEARWGGYNEAMILYVLALGSPSHPIDAQAWDRWTSSYQWDIKYDYPHVTFGPLFGHQYSHVWIDFRAIQDRYMRAKGIDYFVNSTRATYANRAYCIENPGRWAGYGGVVWGLTASDGPRDAVAHPDDASTPFRGYWARGDQPQCSGDDGTIAPTAVGGSVPFAPEVTIPTLQLFRSRFGARLYGKYGFKDAFNLSVRPGSNRAGGWFDDQYVAIDQGPILLMVENHRTGSVWNLMRRSSYLRIGLERAGFTGGWLAPTMVTEAPPAQDRSVASP